MRICRRRQILVRGKEETHDGQRRTVGVGWKHEPVTLSQRERTERDALTLIRHIECLLQAREAERCGSLSRNECHSTRPFAGAGDARAAIKVPAGGYARAGDNKRFSSSCGIRE